ncbi:Hpt domain-containing protein [Candidatus Sulfurimonas baltica]|uniref:Hpt domain-containing protein n=1 Tax=Candidatus Sulfurimonas baltica TaxID=2740404 RepID=A0A7S7RMI3_9BACT|nr:Hpt domain-containing protein [Candidatus Sulfurimonas baltica]QOY51506.1 Hpt domain-containing protein [Candidatus Sulfurimonas baltica]
MGIRSDLDASFDYEIVDEFLDHYSMMVDNMETMIIDLSRPNMFEQSINELFRVFHNIKSASGYLKIEQMSKLSAFVEDSLEQIRTSHQSVNEETVNWLLRISDMYAQWNEDLKLNNSLSHIKYTLLKLPDLEK